LAPPNFANSKVYAYKLLWQDSHLSHNNYYTVWTMLHLSLRPSIQPLNCISTTINLYVSSGMVSGFVRYTFLSITHEQMHSTVSRSLDLPLLYYYSSCSIPSRIYPGKADGLQLTMFLFAFAPTNKF
jgi:hypothetical protein